MFRSSSPRLALLLILGLLSLPGMASAAVRTAVPAKSRPACVASAGESVFLRLGRLVRLWAGNGAIVDPMGYPAASTPTATVPTGSPWDDNGAIIDPMGGH